MKYWPYIILAIILPISLVVYIIALGYTSLTEALITLPAETEILLFTVMAGVGAGTVGHFLGSRKGARTKALTKSQGGQRQSLKLMYLVLIGALIALFVIPFVINAGAEFSGTDGQGPDAIEDSGYTPWIEPMGYQPDELGERVFFSLQVAIGGAIIGYFIGYTRARS